MVKTDKEEIKDLKKRVTIIEGFFQGKLSENGRLIYCPKCKKSWLYRGNKKLATCTNCGSKVKVE